MTNTKHTPGPWLVERQIANYRSGATSLCITSRCEGGVTQTVASIVSIDSGKANAKLIAAAPEQHEVLCSAPVLSMYHGANGFEQERFIKDYETWSEQKRAAIAKATGGEA